MNFIDIKANEKIWIVTNTNNNKNTSAVSFSNIIDSLSSLGSLIESESEKIDYAHLSMGIIKEVIYPGKRKTGPYCYMKMEDGRPNGVGETYGEEEDKNLIQLKVLNAEKDCIEDINIYNSNDKNSYIDAIANKGYFIYLNDAKHFLYTLYNNKIDELNKKKNEITTELLTIINLKNSLEHVK